MRGFTVLLGFRASLLDFFIVSIHPQIYPHMCAKFGRDPTVMLRKKEGLTDTHKGILQLYSS